jgi:hypothetical protein
MGLKQKNYKKPLALSPVRVDVNVERSDKLGISGIYETFLRRFKVLSQVVTLIPLYILASLCLGIAIVPAIFVFNFLFEMIQDSSTIVKTVALGFTISFSYFIFGFSLLLVVPLFNFMMRAQPKPHRGPYFSSDFLTWYIHNGLTYLARYTFLEFVSPTPFNVFFYRMMGMKIGKNTHINTTNISDPALIELGDRVTVGGSVTICAHYGQGGFLVLAHTRIGSNVTLGLRSVIMGGVEIGADAKVLPNSVVLPKTKIPKGETWGGVPAKKIG